MDIGNELLDRIAAKFRTTKEVERLAWSLFEGINFGGKRGGAAYVIRKAYDIMRGGSHDLERLVKKVLEKWFDLMRSKATKEKLSKALKYAAERLGQHFKEELLS